MNVFKFILHGKQATWTQPAFYFAKKIDGATLCLKVWLEPGKVQQAETLTVEEYGQLMGGN